VVVSFIGEGKQSARRNPPKSTRHGMSIGRQQEHTTWNVYRSTTRAHDMECVSVDNKSTRHGMCIGRQQEHTTWNVYHFRYVHSLDSVIF
jgi:hypothetical protein